MSYGQGSYNSQYDASQTALAAAPEPPLGSEAARAYEANCECAKLISELMNRLVGPTPISGSASKQDDSLRGQIRIVANIAAENAANLRHLLQTL